MWWSPAEFRAARFEACEGRCATERERVFSWSHGLGGAIALCPAAAALNFALPSDLGGGAKWAEDLPGELKGQDWGLLLWLAKAL